MLPTLFLLQMNRSTKCEAFISYKVYSTSVPTQEMPVWDLRNQQQPQYNAVISSGMTGMSQTWICGSVKDPVHKTEALY